jgi:general secretion pathway protein F
MALYYYKAATASGELTEGSFECASEKAAKSRLQGKGLLPLAIATAPFAAETRAASVAAGGKLLGGLLPKFRLSSASDRLEFTQEFSTLLGSGVPVDRSLAIVARLATSERMRDAINEILRLIRGGANLADAMEAQGRTFSKLYVNLVRAGQASGTLPEVFARLAEYEQRSAELRSHIISSLIYPALLILVSLASMFVMLYFVVPRFGEVFSGSGIPMPASTAALIWVGEQSRRFGLLILVALAGGVLAAYSWARTPAGTRIVDRSLISAPLLGDMVCKAETAQFARTMSTLVGHGVPIVESLRIVRESLRNSHMAGAFEGIIQGVKRGEGVAQPFARAGVFPDLAVQLLGIGEETGRLDQMFERVATVYEAETRTTIRRLTAIFEPAVILVMGLVIGSIVLSLLMAITSMNEISL